MTVLQDSTSRGWRTWRLTCDRCGRSWWTALTRYPAAVEAAHASGWMLTDAEPTAAICPHCVPIVSGLQSLTDDDVLAAITRQALAILGR